MGSQKKKIFLIIAGLIIALIIFLPAILSSDFILGRVLAALNKKTPGDLSIESCSIGWKNGLACSDLIYLDPEKGLKATVSELTASQGLLELAVAPKNLGTITVQDPLVEITTKAPTKSTQKPDQKQPASKESPSPGEKKSSVSVNKDTDKTPIWSKLIARLDIQNGRLINIRKDHGSVELINNLALESVLSRGSLNYALNLSGKNSGTLALKGFANLPANIGAFADAMVLETDLATSKLDLRDFLKLSSDYIEIPTGTATLNTILHIKAAGSRNMTVSGEAALSDVHLKGAQLRTSPISLENAVLNVDLKKQHNKQWNIKKFNLEADPGKISATGTYLPGDISAKVTGTLLFSVLTKKFPQLLKLREGVSIQSGKLQFDLDLKHNPALTALSGASKINSLKGSFKQHSIAWNQLSLNIQAQKSGENISVEKFILDAPFIKAYGGGDLESFELSGSADLHKGLTELGKIYPLEWNGMGDLTFKLNSKSTRKDHYSLASNIRINDFVLNKSKQTVFPKDNLLMEATMTAPLTFFTKREESADFRLIVSSWPGIFSLKTINFAKSKDTLSLQYDLVAKLYLDKITNILHTFGLIDKKQSFAGEAQIKTTGSLDKQLLSLEKLTSKINGFSLRGSKVELDEKTISFRLRPELLQPSSSIEVKALQVYDRKNGKLLNEVPSPENQISDYSLQKATSRNLIDLKNHSLKLQALELKSGIASIDVDKLILSNWKAPLDSFSAGLTAEGDLNKISQLLKATGKIPAKFNFKGLGTAAIATKTTPEKNQNVSMTLHLANFDVSSEQKQLLKNEKIDIELEAVSKKPSNDLLFNTITLISKPLRVEASGGINRHEEGDIFNLTGSYTPDFKIISPMVEELSGKKILLRGKQKQPFSVLYPLGKTDADKKMSEAQISHTVSIEGLDFEGIELAKLKVPLTLENSLFKSKISGIINEGTLGLSPHINFKQEPALLRTVPAKQQVISKLLLKKPLSDGFLGRLHPLFGTLTNPSGQIDMTLETLSWPLIKEGSNKASFATIVDVSDVRLEPSLFLAGILTYFKLDHEDISIENSSVNCSGDKGRITCSPVKLIVAESEMKVSGSIGLDKTIDYTLEIPVTKKLVGTEGYRVLQGTTIKVPIRGTIGKPSYDKNALTGTLSDLLHQAAKQTIQKQIKKSLPGLLDNMFNKPDK